MCPLIRVGSEQLLVVGSRNPAKISAATVAAQHCFPHVSLKTLGVGTVSGVRDQPFGDKETLQGAINRIRCIQQQQDWPPDALLVSIEGGLLQRSATELHCFAWAAVKQTAAGATSISTARSAEFLLPRRLSKLVLEQGLELGDADDKMFGRINSGQGSGTVGHLTNNVVTRTDYYQHTVIMALIPFMTPELYPEFCKSVE